MKGNSSSSPRIGDFVEVEIEKLIFGGAGLARWRGMVVFVHASAPKDRIRARVIQKRSHYLEAEIEEVLSPSPERVSPSCRHVPSCGGCQWQHLSLPAQRQWKERILGELLSPLASGDQAAMGEILPVSPPEGYRSRAQVKVEVEGNRSRLGFYRPRSQALEEIEFCPLFHPDLQKIYRSLRDLKYPTLTQLYPSLMEIWMQRGYPGGEILLTLITPRTSRAALRWVYHRLKEVFPHLAGIALAWGRDGAAYDQAGDAYVEMALRGLKLRVGPTCFYQVGEAGAETIFQIMESWIGPAQIKRVLDLYCGVGTFCLPLAKGGKEVVGVEAHGEAACLARENAERNELFRVNLIHGTAEQALFGPLAEETYDLVILDPPRSGLSRRTMEGLLRLSPPRILYISCDPSTFARDLARLLAKGYECRRIQPLDLFPHTYHIETMAWLERGGSRP